MKINLYKIPAWLKAAACIILLSISMAGCKKDTPQASGQAQNGSTIKFVLNDNFNFGVVYGALNNIGLLDSLAKPGPYTFIAPNNAAYLLLHIPYPFSASALNNFPPGILKNMLLYYMLDGKIAFKAIPLVQNKPYKTHTGGNIYVSRYLEGADTVTAINGVKLASVDNPASNGLIQVLPQTLNPELYPNAVAYLHGDTSLSLFSAALQRTGLDKSLLLGSDAYTLLAPDNAAFQQSAKLGLNLGVSTLDSILIADPLKLTAFLKCHIIKGRYFGGDLFHYAEKDPTGIAVLNGSKVIIGGDPNGFQSITFLGNGNNGIPSVVPIPQGYGPYNNTVDNANIPCGNAVIHIINQVLVP